MTMCHISRHHHWDDRRERWGMWADEPAERDPAPPPPRDPDLRVSQAERDEVAAALARHFADGRLTVEEYEERVEAALSATTGHDLDPVLVDLPADPPAATVSPARTPSRRPSARSASGAAWPEITPGAWRLIAVAAVVVLAIATGPWALWLLWPALVLTGSCGRRRHHSAARRREHEPVPHTLERL
jgi:hypothetical protein